MAEADRLAEYEQRRDFSKTREPKRGGPKKAGKTLGFVVQKHDARRLHYDFRLEWDGALLSWAVTRGPSDDPGEKRLAVRTEDHPLDYADFEGTIPKGHYGGGTVMVWDRGTWEPLHDPAEGLKSGKLHFNLSGERMQGGWALVRMRRRSGEKRENWLLIKERDETASDTPDALTEKNLRSVKTGRSLKGIESDKPPKKPSTRPAKAKAAESKSAKKMPAFRKPQLATLYDTAPEGEDWLHETKFDGYRCIAAIAGGKARLFTRSGKDWTEKYAALDGAFEVLGNETLLIDGEIMAADIPKGQSAFSALQQALHDDGALVFYVFDILERGGKSLTEKPLSDRKAVLEQALAPLDPDGPVRLSTYITGDGSDILKQICKAGGEGIISKRADAPYSHSRTSTWRKVKCTKRQEFVIGGYSPSDKKGRPFSSLLVGQFDEDGGFHYRGRVGTGFSEETLETLAEEFSARARKTSPFDDVPASIARKARWVTPELVAEVDFAEFTADGHIRHGAFLGLRDDKEAKTVAPEKSKASDAVKVAGIAISHPDRQLFGKAGISKGDLAEYYGRAGKRMLEASGERPFSLLRYPSGIADEGFFQKHAGKGFPDELTEIDIEEKDGSTAQYLYTKKPAGFVAAAQFGTIEFHGWGSRVDRLERPDRLIFDLDPDEGLGFAETKKAAFDMRDLLEELGLAATAMVTGGKGIHVTVPLRRTVSWDTLKMFAKTFAHILAEREPERFTATMSKEKRKGKIFIDWLRNERGATAIMPYSVRAREGAPVATPVTWEELKPMKSAAAFTLPDMDKRLAAPCPYVKAFKEPQSLSAKVIDKLEKLAD
ncbi:DNA ligase D [Martelella endophytica]|uniref:DNA ligase (ATP) n=1 Tax=Martelella endophytica TaxID=1486262 RepID=A0A0D5LKF2_MAREN|nr:DNA ligase D [Martelella endophytica]AJY44631.1 ATP-dependent DNA ligase [Martelella endophytica]